MIDNTSPYTLQESSTGLAVDADQQQSQITVLRRPFKADAPAVHRLVTECPPLDLNSLYTYLLLSEHFSDTCVVAEHDGILDGYLSAYIPPAKPDVLFVWQVAVHSRARGRGLGRSMLSSLLERPGLRQVRYIETTVGSNNAASRGMFAGFARMLRADCRESPLFEQQLFGPSGHDDEPLIRIGPFEVLHK